MKRLLIIARDYNAAMHWAKDNKMSPGTWVYISSYHNIHGNEECEYICLPGAELRPDMDMLESALRRCKCVNATDPVPSQS